jgi:hypothetical protein
MLFKLGLALFTPCEKVLAFTSGISVRGILDYVVLSISSSFSKSSSSLYSLFGGLNDLPSSIFLDISKFQLLKPFEPTEDGMWD